MAPVLKTGVPQGTAGSNPALSARASSQLAGGDGGSRLRLFRLEGWAEVGDEPLQHAADELRVAAVPAVLDVEVDHRPVDVREAHLEQRAVMLFPLAHDEDAVRPPQQLACHRRGREGSEAG